MSTWGAWGASQAEIPVREMALGARACGVLELRRPGPVACDLAHQPMRRLFEIVGHLHGERPAGLELGDERRQQRLVIRNPLQHRIGEDHVERRLRAPFGECRRPRKRCREDACAPLRSCRAKNRGRRSARPGSARAGLRSNCPGRSRCRRRWTMSAFGIRATRSRTGRVRSCSNLTYWAADQVIAGDSMRAGRLHATRCLMAQATRRPCLRRRLGA